MSHQVASARRLKVTVSTVALAALAVVAVSAIPIVTYEFGTPIFKIAVAPDGSVLVADAGAGIVELRNGKGSLIAERQV